MDTTESVVSRTIQNLKIKTAEFQNHFDTLEAILHDKKTSIYERADKGIDLLTEEKTSQYHA
jgi:hypothetical protein